MKSRIPLSRAESDSTRSRVASGCGWGVVSEWANMESLESDELARILA